jgi:hypothetical protein
VKRTWFAFAAFTFASGGAAVLAAAPPQGTTTIQLPGNVGPAFKEGPGVEAARQYCTECHAPAYVAIQPPLTANQWTAEVTKMVQAYGAPIPADAVAPIVQYLTTEYGKP